jgi:hypothetical protein
MAPGVETTSGLLPTRTDPAPPERYSTRRSTTIRDIIDPRDYFVGVMYAPAPAIAQGKGECVHQISCGGPGLWSSIGRFIATCWTDHERTNTAAAYGRGGRARRRLSAVGSDRRHLHGKCISVGHTSREPLELGGRFRCPTFGQPIDIVNFVQSCPAHQPVPTLARFGSSA